MKYYIGNLLIICSILKAGVFPALIFALIQNKCAADETVVSKTAIDNIWAGHLTWREEQESDALTSIYRESLLREALRISPDNTKAARQLIDLYRADRETSLTNAFAHYLSSPGTSPAKQTPSVNEIENVIKSAQRYLGNGNVISAEAELRQALQRHPDNIPLLMALGHIYVGTRETAMGEAVFGYAAFLAPNNLDAANNYAFFLRANGKPRAALEHLLKFNETQSADNTVFRNIIALAGSLDDFETAMTTCSQWTEQFPNEKDAWLQKAHLHLFENNDQEAYAAAIQARNLEPADFLPVIYLIQIFLKSGKINSAAEQYRLLPSLCTTEEMAAIEEKYKFGQIITKAQVE